MLFKGLSKVFAAKQTCCDSATFCNVCVFDGNLTQYGYTCQGNNVFTFTIYNVQRSTRDGSLWRCEQNVGNAGYIASGNVTLNVLVRVTSVTLTPSFETLSVIAAISRQFRCQTSAGVPAPTVQWFKTSTTSGSTPFNITSLSSSVPSESGIASTLNLVPRIEDDGMRIHCTAENVGSPVESASKPVLNILYGPRRPVCTYRSTTQMGQISVIQGRSLSISCTSDSRPAPNQYKWTYPTGSHSEQQLTIGNINASFSGTFTIEVKNTMTATDSLTAVTETNTTDIEVVVLYPPSTPTFRIDSVPVSGTVKIISGNTMTIQCSSLSNPASRYTWSPGGNGNSPDLVLNDVQHPTSSRVHTCTAQNTMQPTRDTQVTENAESSVTIEVMYISKPVFHYGSATGSNITSNSLRVVKGAGRSVYCVSQANPPVFSYSWSSGLSTNQLSTSSLNTTINVTCTVQNQMLETSSSNATFGESRQGSEKETLSVILLKPPDVPQITYQHQCSLGSIPAQSSLKIIEGDSFCLICSSSSDPPASYNWSGPASSTTSILRLNNIARSVTKLTSCKAENTMTTTFDGYVTGSNTATLTLDILYGPSVTEMSTQKVVRGDPFQYDCQVTPGNPAETTYLWNRTGSSHQWPSQRLNLSSVKRQDDAVYTCTAWNFLNPTTGPPNQKKTDFRSFHLDVLFGAENLVFNPDKVQGSNSFSLTENSSVTLKCALDSNPGSLMVISKDGSELLSKPDTTSLSYNISSSWDDAGVYACKGNNQYTVGLAAKDIDIHILCTPRAAPNVAIHYNVSSARKTNATLSFTALAFPPLLQSSFSWQKCTTSGCAPVLRDKTLVNLSTSGFGNRLAECNQTIVNVEEEDYTEYQIAVNGAADRKWSFFLNALDKPRPPTNFMVMGESVTETSANVTWKAGLNGGLPQTFKLQLRQKGASEWTMHNIKDMSTLYNGYMHFEVYGLQSGSEYELELFASNYKGNSSSVFAEFTTMKHIDKDSIASSSKAGVIAGSIVGGLIGLLAIVMTVVALRKYELICKCVRKPESTGEALYVTSAVSTLNNAEYESLGHRDNIRRNQPNINFSGNDNELGTNAYDSLDAHQSNKHVYSELGRQPRTDQTRLYENTAVKLDSGTVVYVNTTFENA